MENLDYAQATSTPGYVALARRYASAGDFYATSHPSLPNYLALAAGSTFGVTTDCEKCFVQADNLGAQLSGAHLSWGDFSQSLPSTCFLGDEAGEYAAKHNPFRYFDDVRSSRALCDHLHPLGTLLAELRRGAAAVPAFSFVTPNLCDDGHSCPHATAFAWLSSFLATVTSSAAYADHGIVVVTWDEGADADTAVIQPDGTVQATGGGGHIPTLVLAAGVPRGWVVHTPLSHFALLATWEHNFSLPYLRGAEAWSTHTLTIP